MTRRRLKKICTAIFHINIVLGLAAFAQNIYVFISSGYQSHHLFNLGFPLIAIAVSSPRSLYAQLKFNYPEKIEKMQCGDEKPTDIEFLCFLVAPVIANLFLLGCLFSKPLWKFWIM